MKTLLWSFAVILSGVAGFYFGIGHGARTLGTIAADNQVSDGVSRLRVSLDALQGNSLERANQLHEQNLKSALLQIGSYSPSVACARCTDEDRKVMQATRDYVEAHRVQLNAPLDQFQLKGLAWCEGDT